jgi:hypothetical protein
MRRTLKTIALASLTLVALPLAVPAFSQTRPAAPAATAAPPAPAAKATHHSVETTLVGKLIDDPAAAAILKKLVPGIWANEMFQSMGRDQTLRGIQQYEQDLTDAKLAEIQAEFDKIPAKG